MRRFVAMWHFYTVIPSRRPMINVAPREKIARYITSCFRSRSVNVCFLSLRTNGILSVILLSLSFYLPSWAIRNNRGEHRDFWSNGHIFRRIFPTHVCNLDSEGKCLRYRYERSFHSLFEKCNHYLGYSS